MTPSPEQVKKQFTQAASRYAGGTIMPNDDEQLRRMCDLLRPVLRPGARALDVATGAGHTALALAGAGCVTTGIDFTPAMLEVAAENARAAGLEITFVEMDACALTFADGAFDLVTVRRAPHHFADPATAVAHMRRVLAPGGRLYVLDNSAPDQAGAAAFVDALERLRDPSHHHSLTRAEWTALLSEHGFAVNHTAGIRGTYPLDVWFERALTPPARRAEAIAWLQRRPSALADCIEVTYAGEIPRAVTIENLHLEVVATAV
ncbi:MAG TPA: methyltransferase domain-containing protein [Limnochordia bacterium]|nr:methyltransferase domain-containing protein [Limnochordia bacterium]